MRKELEVKLARRWPGWFDLDASPMSSAMARGFECGDGWFDILWRLCVDLEPLVVELEKATGEPFEVVQVKEKFGGLRFYINHHTDAINQRIREAQGESFRTCEICGQPGVHRETARWIRTVCDAHAERQEER